ncbi:hypothetical protein JQS43_06110 [Natronosporangium hydrolyticum]|uniref:O-antigen ligase domain-containing protein n=1 Tax=Natronosporangium hydrolyticum TaxID=2811111 RepID=A0A895YDM7_9ACTN|nr:hypothetical protein [Natronosporangium hydrolyticum]QSB15904.1 hypothetical protein JQS43_06110 [Natronosporangium hydrolyticum]
MTVDSSLASTTPVISGLPSRRVSSRVRVWPLGLLLAGYPILWLSGLAFVAAPLLAIPMAWELYRRRCRVPAGFGWWIILLAVVALSVLMLGEHAPHTLPKDSGFGRYLAFGMRLADYLVAAVVLLFVGNLTERELPTRRVIRWLCTFFTVTVAGGVAGLVLPPVQVPTLGQLVLPGALLSNDFVRQLTTVSFAQWHSIVGEQLEPRPAAPFPWTNTWGYVLSLLLPWFVIGAVLGARTVGRRVAAIAVLVVAAVPVVYSLNRGLWLALLVLAGYTLIRLVRRGSLVPAATILAAGALAAVIGLASPLAGVMLDRLDNPHSNDGRSNLSSAAFQVALSSPLVGYGGQLSTIGSGRSIAIGASPECPMCGNREVGAEGQLWQLLVTTGFVGTAAYLAFFGRFGWRYRRDGSLVGVAGAANLTLMIFYLPIYTALGMPLLIAMVGMGLWWRSATAEADPERAVAAPAASPAAPVRPMSAGVG